MTQELNKIITEAIQLKAKYELAYLTARFKNRKAYQHIVDIEAAIEISGWTEEIDKMIDEVYNQQYESDKAEREAYDDCEAITNAIEALQSALGLLKGLSL